MESDNNYTNVILEDMNAKFDRLIEVVNGMNDALKTKAEQEDIEEIKADVKVIKAVLTDHSSTLNDHEDRIVALEQRA